jgi:hypothetical protein
VLIVFRQGETLMPRLVKRPEPVRGQLPAGGEAGSFAQGVLKSLQRPGTIPSHQKTESVQLRQGSGETARFIFFQAITVQVGFDLRKDFGSFSRERVLSFPAEKIN